MIAKWIFAGKAAVFLPPVMAIAIVVTLIIAVRRDRKLHEAQTPDQSPDGHHE